MRASPIVYVLAINSTLNILTGDFSHTRFSTIFYIVSSHIVAFHEEDCTLYAYLVPFATFSSNYFRIRVYGKCVSNVAPKLPATLKRLGSLC